MNANKINEMTFSKEFRRLQDKTQMYKMIFGRTDHYRTRLTHSVEVFSIGMEIADLIKEKEVDCDLNFNLLTTMCLAHDLGHAPYGHAGEDAINKMLNKKTKKFYNFKHNINSAIIYYELCKENNPKDRKFDFYVIDGVLKHTKLTKSAEISVNSLAEKYKIAYLIGEYKEIICKEMPHISKEKKVVVEEYMKIDYPLTKEGQILRISDHITQRISDLDDAIRNLISKGQIEILKFLVEDLRECRHTILSNFRNLRRKKHTLRYCTEIQYIDSMIKYLMRLMNTCDDIEIRKIKNKICKLTKNSFIKDVVRESKTRLEGKYKDALYFDLGKRFKKIETTLDDFNKTYILTSQEIELNNLDGTKRIEYLYEYLCNNIDECDKKTLFEIKKKFTKTFGKEFNEISKCNEKEENFVYFEIALYISHMTNNYLNNFYDSKIDVKALVVAHP